jgi:putative tryptophan/tyrosine transport system substrate-binding protein
VRNLARPDGNVTGVANLRPALTGKWLELLREVVPGVTRVAILANRANLDADDYVREVAAATRSWKGESKFFNAGGPRDFESAFAEMHKWRPGGLLVLPDLNFWIHRDAIVEFAGRSRLPAVYWRREYSEAGGLLSYAPSLIDMARQGAAFVDKILKGAKPADVPIEQPTKFELVINLQDRQGARPHHPAVVLLRANQVIE